MQIKNLFSVLQLSHDFCRNANLKPVDFELQSLGFPNFMHS